MKRIRRKVKEEFESGDVYSGYVLNVRIWKCLFPRFHLDALEQHADVPLGKNSLPLPIHVAACQLTSDILESGSRTWLLLPLAPESPQVKIYVLGDTVLCVRVLNLLIAHHRLVTEYASLSWAFMVNCLPHSFISAL